MPQVTLQEAKAFIKDAEKSRENFMTMADKSWNEIKKRQRNHRLWSVTPNSLRKRVRYPIWNSIFKIRQPLLLSRVGIPIGRDTTQDGTDPIGATAAICKERLAVNLAKAFNFYDVLCAARDDFLATNIGTVRAFYDCKQVKERVKEYITPQKDEMSGEAFFINSRGMIVETDNIFQDDDGFFIELKQTVDVDEERVYLEPVLYRDFYVDPDIRRWERCKRIAFAEYYSEPEFKAIFGSQALADVKSQQVKSEAEDDAQPKRQQIKVFEYWDKYEKECLWWAEQGTDFIKPKAMLDPQAYLADEHQEDESERNGIYDLENLFPIPDPLMINAPTDEFWPIPEYYQLYDTIEDVHNLFSRMFVLTRALRTRLLFDNNIDGLQEAINEASEADAFGVSNLTQLLTNAGGSLENVIQYIPVEKMIQALSQLYIALEQRLNTIYKLTGTSDLLQGLITDTTDRTLGERQMTEKYSLNQLAEPQYKMQEYVKNCYELLCEMALKNFKDESLDKYIMPGTLDPEHKERYPAAIGMLKQDMKRFRIELETDSTIALNEQYDKQSRIELVNTLSEALVKTANIAETQPALVKTELHCLKFLIQGFRQGKLFQSEVTQAIDEVIANLDAQKENAPPPFDKDQAELQFKGQQLQANAQIEMEKIASHERIEVAKIQISAQSNAESNQIAMMKTDSDAAGKVAQLQLEYQKLQANINESIESLTIEREKVMLEAQKISNQSERDAFQIMMQEKINARQAQIDTAQQALEQYRVQLDMEERWATERRLQSEGELEKLHKNVMIAKDIKEVTKPPETPKAAPLHININSTPKVSKKTVKIKKDKNGNPSSMEASDTNKGGI